MDPKDIVAARLKKTGWDLANNFYSHPVDTVKNRFFNGAYDAADSVAGLGGAMDMGRPAASKQSPVGEFWRPLWQSTTAGAAIGGGVGAVGGVPGAAAGALTGAVGGALAGSIKGVANVGHYYNNAAKSQAWQKLDKAVTKAPKIMQPVKPPKVLG